MAGNFPKDVKATLIIEPPSEIHFRGPFTRQVLTTLTLVNPSDYKVVFKIKTTAPKRYCVRPNFGIIKPHEMNVVDICLLPFSYDPLEKNRHKFMVQSIFCPADYEENPDKYYNIWKDTPELLADAKLKCVFDMPTEENSEVKAAAKVLKAETSSPPKTKNEEKLIPNMDTSEQSESLTNEVRQLRDENSKLRKENLNLKEQVIRVRSTASKPTVGEPYTPVMVEKQIPMFYIALAIAAVFFGILFGKFLL